MTDTVARGSLKRAAIVLWPYVAVFGLAFVLRTRNLDVSPYGDESFYYFLAHSPRDWFNVTTYPVAASVLPVFLLVYHWFAGTLAGLRVANALVGSLAPVLVMLIARQARVGLGLQLVAGLLTGIDSVEVQFSALVFLDVLGAVLGLIAVWCYTRTSYRWAAFWMLCAVLEKETYVFLAAAVFADYLLEHRRLYRELLIAVIPVGLFLTWRFGIDGASMSWVLHGHASVPLTARGVEEAIGSVFLVPLILAGSAHRGVRALALYLLILLVFIYLWGNAQIWYWALSTPAAFILAAVGANDLLAWGKTHADAWLPALKWAVGAALGGALLVMWTPTRAFLTDWHTHNVLNVANYLDTQKVGTVYLVNCFWGYTDYPFGMHDHAIGIYDGVVPPQATWVVVDGTRPTLSHEWHVLLVSGPYTVLHR